MLVDNEVTVTAQWLGVPRLPWPVMCDELSPPVTTVLANLANLANPANRLPPGACAKDLEGSKGVSWPTTRLSLASK
ncbi:hypothetical protein [Aeromonas media]|uniref:hypothetical protein n=1 Tax=Aeromonas media TaxID=651 RepID=UPI003CFD7066